MTRAELTELHYILPLDNVPSVLQHGILSHKRVERLTHRSVAMEVIQDRRARVVVPGGRPLHDCVNLYICARNPMLFKVTPHHSALCVLRVAPNVLDLPGVVITDQNASSDHRRFAPAPDGLRIVDRDMVFARSWKHPDDQIAEWRHKSAKCAEVLVPDHVEPRDVVGAYVLSEAVAAKVRADAPVWTTVVDPDLFFR